MLTQNLCNQAKKRASGVGLILFIFLLTACGTQPAPPAVPTSPPTETPTPLPTLTPTPTAIPGPFESQPAIPYPSDEVVQGLGITAYQVVGEQYVALSEEGYVVAQAITDEKGEFTGWQRTLPFDVETGLVIPHPQETNPELFELKKSDAPIPQFVNAMKMAGIEVEPEIVANNLQYQTITGADGKQYVIGTFNLDPDPNQQGETLEGPIPLLMWSEEEGWTNLSLKDGKKVSGIEIGFSGWWPDNTDIIKREGQLLLSAWEFIFNMYNDPPLVNEDGVYNFRHTDNVVRLAKQNGLQLRVQDLLNGVPSFIERGNYSKEDLLKFIERHVRTMVRRYKGKVAQWSVANEIMHPWGNVSFLYRAFGGDLRWLELAFKVTREIDPNATLLLNDTGIEFLDPDLPHQRRFLPGYNERFYQVVKQLKESGVPIDAVGFQMHLRAEEGYTNPALRARAVESFKANVRRYNELGVDVYITEFDLRLGALVGRLSREERLRLQTQIYQDFVNAAKEVGVKSITFFAVKDADSWLEIPEASAGNAGPHPKDNDPCLFDDYGNKKPAYYGVLTALISNQE